MRIENTRKVLITDNKIWLPEDPEYLSYGIYIDENVPSEENNNDSPNNPSLKILNNYFYNGNTQINIFGTSNLIPVYIYKNTFVEGKTNMWLYNIYGTISENQINSNTWFQGDCECIHLYAGNPDFYNNGMKSSYSRNFDLTGNAYPNLSPIRNGNEVIWIAGKNTLESQYGNNVTANSSTDPCNILTDYGDNSFSSTNSGCHFAMYINMDCNSNEPYKTNCNTWFGNNGAPYLLLYGLNNCGHVPYVWQDPNCYQDEQIVDRIITYIGFGIFDTVFITQSNSIPPPDSDANLYGLSVNNQLLKNYSTAITNLKSLVNSYPNSNYLSESIYKLYECYVSSDTNHNQNWRNAIFGNLKNYLEEKMQSYDTILHL